jgi:hypothetical protein
MAIPAFVMLPVAQFLKKKWIQNTMWNKVALPSPETKTIQVQVHNHSSTQVHSHLRKINAKCQGPWKQERDQGHQIQEED